MAEPLVVQSNSIELNGVKYPLGGDGQVHPVYQKPLGTKQVTGDFDLNSLTDKSMWAIKDLRGGILVEEMDEKVDGRRSYWTDCETMFRGEITLPNLATKIVIPNWSNPTSSNDPSSDWISDDNIWDDDVTTNASATTDPETWTGYLEAVFSSASVVSIAIWVDSATSSDFSLMDLDYYDGSWNDIYEGAIDNEEEWITKALNSGVTVTGVTKIRVRFYNNHDSTIRTVTIGEIMIGVDGSPSAFVDAKTFNSELYVAHGAYITKLDSGGNFLRLISERGATITALEVAFGELVIALGDSDAYDYMNTSESFSSSAQSNDDFTHVIVWDGKLFGADSEGNLWKMTALNGVPADADSNGSLSNSLDDNDLQGFKIYRDAADNDIIYAHTRKGLWAYDFDNSKWYLTEAKGTNHPNGGKGCVVSHGSIFMSSGLQVVRYQTGAAGTELEFMGLDQRDGLPAEYAGEIVGMEETDQDIIALVDASAHPQTYESLTTGATAAGVLKGIAWGAQTFTPTNAHTTVQVKLLIYRSGSPGTINVSIRATDGSGHPTGSDLASGTSDGDTLTTDSSGEWRTISLSSYALSASTKYAIVVSVPSGGPSDNLRWLSNGTGSDDYTRGNRENSADSGSSWVASDANIDYLFEEQGGTTNSGVYAWRPEYKAWRCIYNAGLGASLEGAFISTATRYSLYLAIGGNALYYITLPRGGTKPKKDFNHKYAPSATLYTPWFDAGWILGKKVALALMIRTNDCTATEKITVSYRTDHVVTALGSGWTDLAAITSDGTTIFQLPSSATPNGVVFESIQLKFALERGGTTTKSPILQYALLAYTKEMPRTKATGGAILGYQMTLDCTKEYNKRSPSQLLSDLVTAAQTIGLIPFTYHNVTSYVRIESFEGERNTGALEHGQYSIIVKEL